MDFDTAIRDKDHLNELVVEMIPWQAVASELGDPRLHSHRCRLGRVRNQVVQLLIDARPPGDQRIVASKNRRAASRVYSSANTWALSSPLSGAGWRPGAA